MLYSQRKQSESTWTRGRRATVSAKYSAPRGRPTCLVTRQRSQISPFLYFQGFRLICTSTQRRGDVSTREAIMLFESGREWQIDRPPRQMESSVILFLPSFLPDKTGLINGTIRTWNLERETLRSAEFMSRRNAMQPTDGRTKGDSRFSEKAKSAIAVIHVQNSGIYCLEILLGWARKRTCSTKLNSACYYHILAT